MDEFAATIARIRAFPARIQDIVAPLTNAQLQFRPHAHEWSILEHIGHIIDIDGVYRERIAQICAQEYQPFALFSIDGIHQQGNYQAQSITALLQVLHATRGETVRMGAALTARDSMRIGIDAYFGEITLARLIEILANHEDEHYDAICRIVAQLTASEVPPQALF